MYVHICMLKEIPANESPITLSYAVELIYFCGINFHGFCGQNPLCQEYTITNVSYTMDIKLRVIYRRCKQINVKILF